MKILQTIKYYDPCKGGMEAVAKNLVDTLIKSGEDVDFTVYCNNHVKSSKTKVEQRNPKLQIIREKTRILVKSQPLQLRYRSLTKLIEDTDVVHHHYPYPTMEFALLKNLKLLKSKKFVITWHANIQNSRWAWIEKIYKPLILKLLNVADKIIVTSPQLYEASPILGSFKEKIEVIPLSFDPVYKVSQSKNLGEQPRKILFVGKLREYKGLKYLIEAMKNIDAQLDIVGNGEKEEELRDQVSALQLSAKIKFHTDASDEDLRQFYKDADLFVLPSINEAEAFGVVQLEALSSGLPVINTRLNSGVPFVSLDGITGATVRPEQSQDLTIAINRILNDNNLYSQYSKNAIERAHEFAAEKMASKYLDTYK